MSSISSVATRLTRQASWCAQSTNGRTVSTWMRSSLLQLPRMATHHSLSHYRWPCLNRRVCGNREDNPVSKEKILVVEDAPDISSLLKIYFTSQGYEVMTAMRGAVALELCRKTPPNLA